MCVGTWNKKYYLDNFKKKLGRRKTFIGYKVLTSGGYNCYSSYGRYQYGPGVNSAHLAKTYTYTKSRNRGIHVYLDKNSAVNNDLTSGRVVVEVLCHVDDLMIVDHEQAALRRVTITEKEWGNFKRRARYEF